MKRTLTIFAGCFFTAMVSLSQVVNTFPYTTNFELEIQGATGAGSPYTMLTPGWMNDTNDDNDWIADSAGTASSGTGPSVDHTTGTNTGYYMYVESSTNNVGYPNMENILLTPYFDFTALANPKLSFWYHMLGGNMGNIYVEASQGSGSNWLTLGTWNSNVNLWQNDSVSLCAFAGQDSVRIRFRGVTGAGFESDMALDDIMVFEGIVVSPANVDAVSIDGSDTLCATSNFPVNIYFTNTGCQTSGDVVIYYATNVSGVTTDTITGLSPGSLFTYAIPGGLNISTSGYYELWCTTSDMTDTLYSGQVYFDAPIDPVTTGATICASDVANLTATGDAITWYNSSGGVVGSGNSFTTPGLSSTTSYYAENKNYLPNNSLTTTFAATTSCVGGNMFDVIAENDLAIDSLFLYPNSGGMQPVEVWYKTGSYSSAAADSTQWTLLLTDSVDGSFATNPTVNLSAFKIKAGDTVSFYVLSYLAYTNSGAADVYSNNDITFVAGNGHCGRWDNCCDPRVWNGVIYYRPISECVSNQVEAQVTVQNCDTNSIAIALNVNLRVYPNPAHTAVNIESSLEGKLKMVELITITGQSVFSTSELSSNQLTIHVENYPKGVYSLKIIDDNGIYFKKLLIE